MSTLLRWSYADHAVEARKLRGDTEKEWIAERNGQFKKLSKKVGMGGCHTKFGYQDTLSLKYLNELDIVYIFQWVEEGMLNSFRYDSASLLLKLKAKTCFPNAMAVEQRIWEHWGSVH